MNYDHVVITTDLSEVSNRAVEYFSKKSKDTGKITLLTVIPEWPLPAVSSELVADPHTLEEFNTNFHASRKKALVQIAEKYFKGGAVSCEVISTPHSVGKGICDFAKSSHCDLLVIGRHGAGFLEKLLLGSTAMKVLSAAPCPVLVIPYNE